MRPFLDRFLRSLARLVCHVFFRQVETVGAERLRRSGPTIYVANHGNALVDGILLQGWLPPGVRFLGKSTLWDHPALRYLVRLAGAIPVYRSRDPGVDPRRNREMFERVEQELAAGGAVAIFPEGVSHPDPELKPLKSGAARIALAAEAHHGPLALRIVPVGLVFEARHAFRSRVLLQIGEPLDPSRELTPRGSHDPAAVRRLTARIDAALRAVTLNYLSWRDARLIARAVDLWLAETTDPSRPGLAQRVAARRLFAQHQEELERRDPQRVAAVRAAVRRYDRLLAVLGLSDAQVASRYGPRLVGRFLWRTVAVPLAALPVAAVGALLNWLPYRIPGWVTRALDPEPETASSYKVLIALVLYPVAWGVEALLGWLRFGPAAGVLVLAVAPSSGLVALFVKERTASFRTETRAFLLLRARRRLAAELRARRQEVVRGVEALVALARRADRGEAPSGAG